LGNTYSHEGIVCFAAPLILTAPLDPEGIVLWRKGNQMKSVLFGALLATLVSTGAFAQKVCGYMQRAVAGGPETYLLSGVACVSREPAIALAHHKVGQGLTWLEAIDYVNGERHDKSCFTISNLDAREISTTISSDQYDQKYAVKVWEAKIDGITRTIVTADYLDGC
jgi:hypothetical protein